MDGTCTTDLPACFAVAEPSRACAHNLPSREVHSKVVLEERTIVCFSISVPFEAISHPHDAASR